MMVLSARRPDASLLEFVAQRARLATARRLAADVIVGALGLAGAGRLDSWTRSAASMAAVCLIAYGSWGLLERARQSISSRGLQRIAGAVEAVRALLALGGILAGLGVLLSVWAIALGTWIS